jgi:hypothetical protein
MAGAWNWYEWVDLDVARTGSAVSASISGFEFLILQAGSDIRMASWFGMGPFLMFSLGRYGGQTLNQYGYLTPDGGTGLHAWLTFGLRGNFSLTR